MTDKPLSRTEVILKAVFIKYGIQSASCDVPAINPNVYPAKDYLEALEVVLRVIPTSKLEKIALQVLDVITEGKG